MDLCTFQKFSLKDLDTFRIVQISYTLRVPLYFYPYLNSFSVNKNPEKQHWGRGPF